ncbi:MAG: hypothetical protein M3O34_04385 [Chloroflexota bacterium]|nr:hypothetical protein [Chloroflexota bacterium]
MMLIFEGPDLVGKSTLAERISAAYGWPLVKIRWASSGTPASSPELRRRYERAPDLYFSLDVIQAANARFPSLLPLLPPSLRSVHVDTKNASVDEVVARVERFIRA